MGCGGAVDLIFCRRTRAQRTQTGRCLLFWWSMFQRMLVFIIYYHYYHCVHIHYSALSLCSYSLFSSIIMSVWEQGMFIIHHFGRVYSLFIILFILLGAGYDSVPSDIGVYMAAEAMLREYGCKCKEITYFSGKSKVCLSWRHAKFRVRTTSYGS